MRVILTPVGSRGDVAPLIVLGQGLQASGHEVLFCSPPDSGDMVRAAGLEFRPLGINIQDYVSEHAAIVTTRAVLGIKTYMGFVRAEVSKQFTTLMEVCTSADLVIGSGLQFSAASVAEARRIPYLAMAHCPQIFRSTRHPPPVVIWQGGPRWLNRLFWKCFFAVFNTMLSTPLNRMRAQAGLAPISDPLKAAFSTDPILTCDPELATIPEDCEMQAVQFGYMHASIAEDRLDDDLEKFLDKGDPPVYVGFGSMPDPEPTRTTKLIMQAVRSVGCRAVLSRGWAGLGDGEIPPEICVVDEVPHALLFPRMAALVHHGGAGTVAAAARAGVPQIIVPHVLDQFYWRSRITKLGLGVRAPMRRRLTARGLADILDRVLNDRGMAERAARLGERLRRRDAVRDVVKYLTETHDAS